MTRVENFHSTNTQMKRINGVFCFGLTKNEKKKKPEHF